MERTTEEGEEFSDIYKNMKRIHEDKEFVTSNDETPNLEV